MSPLRPTAQPARPFFANESEWNPAGPAMGVQVRPRSGERSDPDGPTVTASGGFAPGTKATASRKPPGRFAPTGVQVRPSSAETAALPAEAASAR